MQFCDQLFDDPAANLAFEEDWLERSDQGQTGELLRVWEAPGPLVVVGRASQPSEVRLEECRRQGVPVLRRCSGGASIVAGPGCLFYAVVLDCRQRPELRMIDQAHAFVLDRVLQALPPQGLLHPPERRGLSDLAVGEQKFSGNSLRCKRDFILYHGTILYAFDLALIEQLLHTPPRQPEYRAERSHGDFVINFPLDPQVFTARLRRVWQADQSCPPCAPESLPSLQRYQNAAWRLA